MGLAIPSIIWYVLFFIVPIGFIVAYSFGRKDSSLLLPVDMTSLSLDNYRDVFDDTFLTVFKATITIAIYATLLCLLIGFPVAYFLAFKVQDRWRGILLALVIVPSFTSFLIRTLAWRIPLAPEGTLSNWLQDWGLRDSPIGLLETRGAVQLALVYNYLGFMILPMFVALDRIQAGLREASKDLGAGRFATFTGVTLPLAGPGIAAGVLLTFIPMCGDYVTATVLGGAKGNMIGAMIASQFSAAQNWPRGSAMAVLMIIAVLGVLAIAGVLLFGGRMGLRLFRPLIDAVRRAKHERWLAEGRRSTEPPKVATATLTADKAAMAGWTVLVLAFLFIPILLVILHSFNGGGSFSIWSGRLTMDWWFGAGTPGGGLDSPVGLFYGDSVLAGGLRFAAIVVVGWGLPRLLRLMHVSVSEKVIRWAGSMAFVVAFLVTGFTTDWYASIFRQLGIGDALRNSFLAAFGATLIAVVIGGLAGVALARHPGWWSKAFMAVIFLILVTPEIMDAIALSGWMQKLGGPFTTDVGPVGFGLIRLWVGQSLYASAVVTLIVRARLAGLDESLEEAAADLGAPPGRAFRQITLPLIASALVAGALLSFTLCLDNTIISALISGADSTFPVALLGATRSTIKPFWGVGAVVLFMVTLSALWFVFQVLRRSGDSSSQIAATLAGG
ncbi:MAG: ABC transporter permease subunit [Actinomycetia bacterium]|nr:ABC transporter permease subunit [Actinomycetes bacterium]